jgi:lipoprotein-releasing system ATP-binding protein
MTSLVVLQAIGLTKRFRDGPREVCPLRDLNLSVSTGETLAIIGPSGVGKSTLLQLLGGLDRPTSGEVQFRGAAFSTMTDTQRTELRNDAIGFVYQFHHLLGEFSALDNVAMPLWIRRMPRSLARQQAQAILARVGLADRLEHRPAQLSGGERQRVAIARALVTKPAVVLADEPTGNLDREAASRVFDLLMEGVRNQSSALVVVTHDPALAARCDRRYEMSRPD